MRAVAVDRVVRRRRRAGYVESVAVGRRRDHGRRVEVVVRDRRQRSRLPQRQAQAGGPGLVGRDHERVRRSGLEVDGERGEVRVAGVVVRGDLVERASTSVEDTETRVVVASHRVRGDGDVGGRRVVVPDGVRRVLQAPRIVGCRCRAQNVAAVVVRQRVDRLSRVEVVVRDRSVTECDCQRLAAARRRHVHHHVVGHSALQLREQVRIETVRAARDLSESSARALVDTSVRIRIATCGVELEARVPRRRESIPDVRPEGRVRVVGGARRLADVLGIGERQTRHHCRVVEVVVRRRGGQSRRGVEEKQSARDQRAP